MYNVIELKNVSKDYGDFKLDSVNLSVPQGCIYGFIGQNGAGKTTTIQLILDIIKRDSGDIKVFDKDIIKYGVALKEDIGVVYDEMGVHEFLTAKDINNIMKKIYSNWNEETFFNYLSRFSLPTKKRCGAFSRGMRMKLQIAVAMSHNAKLLIMDEPTSGLDPIVRNEILDIFQEFVVDEEHTILLSSHITADLERIADMVAFIDHGKIILNGDKNEIIENHGLIKCKEEDIAKFDKDDIVSIKKSSFNTEILVSNRQKYIEKYTDLTIEQTSIESRMLFYASRKYRYSRDER